jgi:hypothetical protein
MSSLYKDALADAQKVRDIATKNAQNAILEALTPKLKRLIETQIMGDDSLDGEEDEEVLFDDEEDELDAVGDEEVVEVPVQPAATYAVAAPVSVPAATTIPQPIAPIVPTIPAAPPAPGVVDTGCVPVAPTNVVDELEADLLDIETRLAAALDACSAVKCAPKFSGGIDNLVSGVENMYDYVQEARIDEAKRSYLEERLETCYEKLNSLREDVSKMKMKKLNESDVTLKLTGLPDDLNLEDIGVDLITGEEDAEEAVAAEEPVDGETGGEDLDLDLDIDGGDAGEETEPKLEADDMDDDTVIEIDENMLRSEIARLREAKKAKEAKLPKNATKGAAMKPKTLGVFGGGKEAAEPVCETDGACDEEEEACETDVSPEADPAFRTKLEGDLQTEAVKSAKKLVKMIAEAKSAGNVVRVARLTKAYKAEADKFASSVARSKKIVTEGSQMGRSNSAPSADVLRKQLSDVNLDNAKLKFANKVLQMNTVSNAKKLQIIEQLDEARTQREAQLVYENAAKLVGSSEGSSDTKQLASGGSRSTRSGSATLTEGIEVGRWAQLAGIK